MGIPTLVWWGMACAAIWLLWRIYAIAKDIHSIVARRFEMEVEQPALDRAAWEQVD